MESTGWIGRLTLLILNPSFLQCVYLLLFIVVDRVGSRLKSAAGCGDGGGNTKSESPTESSRVVRWEARGEQWARASSGGRWRGRAGRRRARALRHHGARRARAGLRRALAQCHAPVQRNAAQRDLRHRLWAAQWELHRWTQQSLVLRQMDQCTTRSLSGSHIILYKFKLQFSISNAADNRYETNDLIMLFGLPKYKINIRNYL